MIENIQAGNYNLSKMENNSANDREYIFMLRSFKSQQLGIMMKMLSRHLRS